MNNFVNSLASEKKKGGELAFKVISNCQWKLLGLLKIHHSLHD